MRAHLIVWSSLAYIASTAEIQTAAPTPLALEQRIDCNYPPEWGRCWKNNPDDLCSCVLRRDVATEPFIPIMTAAPDLSKRVENWNCFGSVGNDHKTSFTCTGGYKCSAGRDGLTSCVG